MQAENWKSLFNDALKMLDATPLREQDWTLGGGMVLMFQYHHRLSKDIDIFIPDPQKIAYLSPTVNDALDDKISDYVTMAKYIKINVPEGDIDFINSSQLTDCQPQQKVLEGRRVHIDDAVEIVMKKLRHRAGEFKARDAFDLTTVYADRKDDVLRNIDCCWSKLDGLSQRLHRLEEGGSQFTGAIKPYDDRSALLIRNFKIEQVFDILHDLIEARDRFAARVQPGGAYLGSIVDFDADNNLCLQRTPEGNHIIHDTRAIQDFSQSRDPVCIIYGKDRGYMRPCRESEMDNSHSQGGF